MSRAQKAAGIGLLIFALLVLWLALRNRHPPLLPADDAHASFADEASCLECHGPDGAIPRNEKHPIGNDCMRCHARGDAAP